MKMLLLGIFLWLAAVSGMAEPVVIGPQSDPQEQFLSCSADIAFIGGGAGGGKTFALQLAPLYYTSNGGFRAVIFRRETTQIRGEGGLWDTSRQLYAYCGATAKESTLNWRFPSGAKISFAHMEHEEDRYKYDGTQFAFIGIDQVESFTQSQFFYLLSRNRSTCGAPSTMRCTCNPVPKNHKVGGWLHKFLGGAPDGGGWIDESTGYAIPEMSGKIRWFVNINNTIHWGDLPDALRAQFPDCMPLSCTFILAKLSDNKILQIKDPTYRAKLMGMRKVERERLLGADEDRGGNWNVHEHAGSFFQRGYFQIIPAAPRFVKVVRYWDRAATAAEKASKGSSYTAGLKLGRTPEGEFVICHVERFQGTPLVVQKAIDNMATQDGKDVRVGIEQDPGQAGKAEAEAHVRRLIGNGFNAYANAVHESKGKRAEPVSAAAEAGLIKIVDGPWVEEFLNEAENYDGTDGCMADQVDALSGAFLGLTKKKEGYIG
jgi:predicted phage terminase large subunit-like protein